MRHRREWFPCAGERRAREWLRRFATATRRYPDAKAVNRGTHWAMPIGREPVGEQWPAQIFPCGRVARGTVARWARPSAEPIVTPWMVNERG
jgi:hypothetical protein